VVIKAVILFLAFMGVLAVFGKKRTSKPKVTSKRTETARKCPKCGAFKIGTGPCACGKKS